MSSNQTIDELDIYSKQNQLQNKERLKNIGSLMKYVHTS